MKYYESKFTKFVGSAGFYVIIACCLIAVGAASWFAVSKINSTGSGSSSQKQNSFPSKDSSYISSADTPIQSGVTPSADVGKSESGIPYSEPQTAASSESKPAAESFSMPIQGEITKGFSDKELMYSATYGDLRMHSGIDIACEKGSTVNACGDGTVVSVDDTASYGKVITIDHGNGITIKYCGISEPTVKKGAAVKSGEVIGDVGEIPSECADQSHIHIEVCKNDESVAPLSVITNAQ